MHEQNHVINIYYNLFRCSRRSVNRFNESKIFQSIFLFFFKQSFFCIETTFFIFPSHNPSAKRPNENYPVKLFEVGNDSVSETRVQRLLLNFSPIRARRPRCVTQRSLRGKYCFDLYPALFVFVFRSLATQSKEIPQQIHWWVQSCKGDGSISNFEIEVRNTLECANFQCSGIRVNECSTNFNPVTNTITRLCNNRDINVG